jgi:CubicO group peptidase (beta-lactamase class C family)
MTRAALLAAALACVACASRAEEVVGLPLAGPAEVGLDPAGALALEGELEQLFDECNVAGAVALVARGGRVGALVSSGWADREAGREMSADTLFRIASMTKPVTTVAALVCVEDGLFGLDDEVARWLPELAAPRVAVLEEGEWRTVSARGPILVRHLLTHTAGFTYALLERPHLADAYLAGGVSDGLMPEPWSLAENVERLAEQPLYDHPGARWEYGLSSDVLGRLIEVTSGQPIDRFMAERVLEPLGMRDTGFVVPPAERHRLARVYAPRSGGAEGPEPLREDTTAFLHLRLAPTVQLQERVPLLSPGVGLVSSAGDYARFLQMLLGGGELDGVRILSEESVALMTRAWVSEDEYPDRPGHGYGFGVRVLTTPAAAGGTGTVGELAWAGIYETHFFVDPEHDAIALLMTQTFPPPECDLAWRFRGLAWGLLD